MRNEEVICDVVIFKPEWSCGCAHSGDDSQPCWGFGNGGDMAGTHCSSSRRLHSQKEVPEVSRSKWRGRRVETLLRRLC